MLILMLIIQKLKKKVKFFYCKNLLFFNKKEFLNKNF